MVYGRKTRHTPNKLLTDLRLHAPSLQLESSSTFRGGYLFRASRPAIIPTNRFFHLHGTGSIMLEACNIDLSTSYKSMACPPQVAMMSFYIHLGHLIQTPAACPHSNLDTASFTAFLSLNHPVPTTTLVFPVSTSPRASPHTPT